MAKKKNRNAMDLTLESPESIFSTQEERDTTEGVLEIPIEAIAGFESHPFYVRDDEEMERLVESVQTVGILVPLQVRPRGERYELISGHRRKRAAEIVGMKTVPALVRDLDDDEAIIAMVDANLQRERVLPSEKGFAFRMKLEALKRQGKRTDLTFVPVEQKSQPVNTIQAIGKDAGESQSQVQRYIRLTYLTRELLGMVDEGKITMRPAVELSYLTTDEQSMLYAAIEATVCTPSHVQAKKMRRYSKEGNLNASVIQSILEEQKPNQVEHFRMPKAKIARFFTHGESAEEIERRIVQALTLMEQIEVRNKQTRKGGETSWET